MKVILLLDIAKVGKRGEVKEVADGYAINVLLAKKKAILATPSELAKWKQKEESILHKKELATSVFAKLLDELRRKEVIVTGKKHDEKGQLFAQIKSEDVVDAIFSVTSLSVDPKQLEIDKPIKALGNHTVYLKQSGKREPFTISVK